MPNLGFSPPLAGQEQDEFTTQVCSTHCKTLVGILNDENKSKKPHAGPGI